MTFMKMNQQNLQCSLKCVDKDTQVHIFQSCRPIVNKLELRDVFQLSPIYIYGSFVEQKQATEIFVKMYDIKKKKTDTPTKGISRKSPKWGSRYQDPRCISSSSTTVLSLDRITNYVSRIGLTYPSVLAIP